MKMRTLDELKAEYGNGTFGFIVIGNCGEGRILCCNGIDVVDEKTAFDAYVAYHKRNGRRHIRVHYIIVTHNWWDNTVYHRGWIDKRHFRWATEKNELAVEKVE